MPLSWKKINPFKPGNRKKGETQLTLQEPQTPPPQRPAPREEVPSRDLLRYATSEAQQHVDQKYPHLTKFDLINHIWRTLVVHIEDIALAQGLSEEEMNNWRKEFRLQLFSSSLTLERAEVVNRLLTDAVTMVDGVCHSLPVHFQSNSTDQVCHSRSATDRDRESSRRSS